MSDEAPAAADQTKEPPTPRPRSTSRRLVHPSGKIIHVVNAPERAEILRRTLSGEHSERFELFIHGSEEHVNVLREYHSHLQTQKDALRERFGQVYEDIEHVFAELDVISADLQNVQQSTVKLNATFAKHGFSANLRTLDDPDSPGSSLRRSSSDKSDMSDNGKAVKFWTRPHVRQYFHKGLLWRAHELQETPSYELFVDLLYVGIIAVAGDTAAEEANGEGLLRFAITFILGWRIWNDVTIFTDWFDSDDLTRRISVLFTLVCLLGYTTNIVNGLDETYTSLISFYLAERLFNDLWYFALAFLIPMIRGAMLATAIHILIPSALWIASIHVERPQRLILIWIAIFLDLLGVAYLITLTRHNKWMPANIQAWSNRMFDFFPGTNIEHKVERTGAFVTLVFGYSVVALLFQNRAAFGINAFLGKAILGLVQAFAFNTLYFEIDAYNVKRHAIRRHAISALSWMFLHLPLVMSYVLAGAALARLVIAHDCNDADPDTLAEPYATRSPPDFDSGLRWFYCGGLGIALFTMSAISLTHDYKPFPTAWLSKAPRTLFRMCIAAIILCLPAAQGRLNSLQLVAITTGLVVLALIIDLVGSSCRHEGFWRGTRRPCAYTAKCNVRRKDLEEVGGRCEEIAKLDGGHHVEAGL